MAFQSANNHSRRKAFSSLVSVLTFVCALLVIAPLGIVFIHLVNKGASSINWDFFTQLPKPPLEPGGGMANGITGTLTLLTLASFVGVPIGVLGGVYLSEYGSVRANWWLRFCGDILNGVPSIIWGIVVYGLIVRPTRSFSAYAGGVALGFLMFPIIMRTTEEVLYLVPQGYREAGLALGIPRWKVIVHIVMSSALKGITTGVLLALARVAGETAPLLFTAFGNSFWNHTPHSAGPSWLLSEHRNLCTPIAALPLQIFNYAISPYEDWHRQAWAGALVLVCFTLFVNVTVRFLTRGKAVKV